MLKNKILWNKCHACLLKTFSRTCGEMLHKMERETWRFSFTYGYSTDFMCLYKMKIVRMVFKEHEEKLVINSTKGKKLLCSFIVLFSNYYIDFSLMFFWVKVKTILTCYHEFHHSSLPCGTTDKSRNENPEPKRWVSGIVYVNGSFLNAHLMCQEGRSWE
jgi:hypothetical protein